MECLPSKVNDSPYKFTSGELYTILQGFLSSLPNPAKSQYIVKVGKVLPFWNSTNSL